MNHSELIIYNSSLTTDVFKPDSRKVANILAPIVLGTYAFEWVGTKFTYINGREIWLDLVSYYHVSADFERRIVAARRLKNKIDRKSVVFFSLN